MGKKKKTKTKNEPWTPLQQPIINAVNTASGIVGDNQPHLDQLAGDVRGFLPQLGQMAFGPNPALQAGLGYAGDVLGGKFLGQGNPFLQGMVHQGEQDAGNAVNSAFSLHGRTGGGANQQALARGVAQAGNTLRYGDYANERSSMAQMAGMLPSMMQAQYAGVTPYLMGAQTAGQLPYSGVSALSPIMGLAAGSGTSTTTEKKGLGQSLMDAAAAAAAAYAQSGSDPRIKEDIEKVGDLAPGLGVYEWTYRQDMGFELPEGRYRGVMADEIAKVAPWMLGTPMHGYLTVRYTPERIG